MNGKKAFTVIQFFLDQIFDLWKFLSAYNTLADKSYLFSSSSLELSKQQWRNTVYQHQCLDQEFPLSGAFANSNLINFDICGSRTKADKSRAFASYI